MTVIAIDQGTTSTRGLEINQDGQPKVVASIAIDQRYPAPGRVEHDPLVLLESIKACLAQSPEATRIGIDNQGESCLAWDRRTGEPITPVIVWQDNRTAAQIEQFKLAGAESMTLERAGLPLDSYFSASKLAWILDAVPAAKKLLSEGNLGLGTTDAFFLDRLTGRYVTDITTASRTSLMNIESGQWDDELCALFGVPPETLPEIVPTTGDFGAVRIGNSDARIVASVVDQQASLYGHGCRVTGDAKITFGTGAFALMVTGDRLQRAPEQGLLPTVAWQRENEVPCYALDGGVYCAGSAVNWARSLGLFENFDSINQFDEPPALSRELAFVPALSGLACPHWDRRAAGLFIGLSLDTGPRDMAQAVLEGIAMRAVEVVQAMEQRGEGRETVSVDGGLTANPWFCQFLADALARRVTVQSFAELTALGTAQLAGAVLDPNRQQDSSTYKPGPFPDEWRSRFANAVSRSREWRQAEA